MRFRRKEIDMAFLVFIAAIYLIYVVFASFGLIAGIAATLLLLLYFYFKWLPGFCVARARNVYPKDAEKALKLFARAEKFRMNIGQMRIYAYYLLREGKVEKSEEIYKKLLTSGLKPELRLAVRADYAVLLLKTGRHDEAIEELEDVIVHFANTTTYGTLGYLYLLKDSVRKAVNFNEEAYDYNSDDPVILDNMTQLYIKLGDYNKAKKYADALLEKKPYFVEAYYDSAYVYMKLGNIKKAKELIDDAKCCKITFMSNVTENDLEQFSKNLDNKIDFEHKLGKFSGSDEYTEEDYKDLPEVEEEKTEEYEYEDDPFI